MDRQQHSCSATPGLLGKKSGGASSLHTDEGRGGGRLVLEGRSDDLARLVVPIVARVSSGQ